METIEDTEKNIEELIGLSYGGLNNSSFQLINPNQLDALSHPPMLRVTLNPLASAQLPQEAQRESDEKGKGTATSEGSSKPLTGYLPAIIWTICSE